MKHILSFDIPKGAYCFIDELFIEYNKNDFYNIYKKLLINIKNI